MAAIGLAAGGLLVLAMIAVLARGWRTLPPDARARYNAACGVTALTCGLAQQDAEYLCVDDCRLVQVIT